MDSECRKWVPASELERAKLRLRNTRKQLLAKDAEIARLKADVAYAAGECLVPIPEPGTDMARLLLANIALKRELEIARRARGGE